jgi:hypothetical protein
MSFSSIVPTTALSTIVTRSFTETIWSMISSFT